MLRRSTRTLTQNKAIKELDKAIELLVIGATQSAGKKIAEAIRILEEDEFSKRDR
jgi:hypothetical protein